MKNIRFERGNRKIKVCHVITKMVYGGASLGTLQLVQGLDPKCFQTSIICGHQSENEGSLLDEIRNSGCEVMIIPEIVREVNPIKDILALVKLMHIMRVKDYDIIHTHGSKAGFIGRLAAAANKLPIVLFTVHGWGLKAGSFFVCRIYRMIERILAGFTTKILFQTKADIAEAYSYKIGKRSQYVLIGNGIKLRPFLNYNKEISRQIAKGLGLWDKKVVGTVGRVSAQKNPRGFLDIAEKCLDQEMDVIFLFVGGGEMLEEMRKLVKELNLDRKVIFLGVRDDIPEVMANFDVFILPSLWEGMPRSLIEAMSLSKPAVVNDINGIDEVVTDGRNGFIVPVHETHTFADKVIYLLKNPDVAQIVGRSGYCKAKEFDYDIVVKKVERMYIDLFKHRC